MPTKKRRKLTLVELIREQGVNVAADAMGYSKPYLYQLLNGERPVTSSVLRAALDVYGNRLDVVATLKQMRRPRYRMDWGGD